jgi:hypothetical protein
MSSNEKDDIDVLDSSLCGHVEETSFAKPEDYFHCVKHAGIKRLHDFRNVLLNEKKQILELEKKLLAMDVPTDIPIIHKKGKPSHRIKKWRYIDYEEGDEYDGFDTWQLRIYYKIKHELRSEGRWFTVDKKISKLLGPTASDVLEYDSFSDTPLPFDYSKLKPKKYRDLIYWCKRYDKKYEGKPLRKKDKAKKGPSAELAGMRTCDTFASEWNDLANCKIKCKRKFAYARKCELIYNKKHCTCEFDHKDGDCLICIKNEIEIRKCPVCLHDSEDSDTEFGKCTICIKDVEINECPICMEECLNIYEIDCGNHHFFCEDCVTNLHINRISTCPLCRGAFTDIDYDSKKTQETV